MSRRIVWVGPPLIIADSETRTVEMVGLAKTVTLYDNALVEFVGVPVNYLIQFVAPNGIQLIDSDYSRPFFMSWKKLLSRQSVWMDTLNVTGWISVK